MAGVSTAGSRRLHKEPESAESLRRRWVRFVAGLDIAVAAKALFEAPFALVSTTSDDPPAVDYANEVRRQRSRARDGRRSRL